MGIERSFSKLREASVVIGLTDGTLPSREVMEQISTIADHMDSETQKLIIVVNKNDEKDAEEMLNKNVSELNSFVISSNSLKSNTSILSISAKKRSCIDKLEKALVETCHISDSEEILVTNARHAKALKESSEALGKVSAGLDAGIPTDLLAEDLREALSLLGTITGEICSNEILGEIFSRFCIGK